MRYKVFLQKIDITSIDIEAESVEDLSDNVVSFLQEESDTINQIDIVGEWRVKDISYIDGGFVRDKYGIIVDINNYF